MEKKFIVLFTAILAIIFMASVFSYTFISSLNKSNQTVSNVTKVNVTPEEQNNSVSKSEVKGKSYTCGYCNGLGYYPSSTDCLSCGGTGYQGDETCLKCGGSGIGKDKKIRCDGCGGDGVLNPSDPGYGYPI